ncbi:phosphopantetheine-binding protein [Lentzea sp. NPDC042327]|uniref:phosphopantetheine-binding protein n=1 Tax=Lentzea sp. NPDC042327 TaxID=3154801 RepID=UPI0033C7611E
MGSRTGREEVFAVLKEQLLEVLPDLDPAAVVPSASMSSLGADSMDRMDVVVGTVEALGIDAALHRFGDAANLGELTELLLEEVPS